MWDVATAHAVVAAGFPVVATTSAGVARSLGYDDHEGAPAGEMLAAAWRIARNVDVPVTVDFEAGYGLAPTDLVAALRDASAAGCNLEETDHSTGGLRDPRERAAWLSTVREAASAIDYPLVINARVDLFLGGFVGGADPATQVDLVPEALERANGYLDAGADCVYPIALWEPTALRRFMAGVYRTGERDARAADPVAGRSRRGRCGPGELGAGPVPPVDGLLRGTARVTPRLTWTRTRTGW